MMLDWNEYRQQLGGPIAELGKLSPGTVRGYRELTQAGDKANSSARRSESSLRSPWPSRGSATAASPPTPTRR